MRADGWGRGGAIVLVLGLVLLSAAGCSSTRGSECGDGAGCAAVVAVPTSSRAAHRDGRLVGIEGTLRATVHDGRLCVLLDRGPAGATLHLVLPAGTRAAPLGELPASGPAEATLIAPDGLGGIRTGDRVVVTPDQRRATASVGGCPAGPTVDTGWMIRLPASAH